MRLSLTYWVAALLLVAVTGCDKPADKPENKPDEKAATSTSADGAVAGLTTDEQKISYIMGVNIGSQFKTDAFAVDMKSFTSGIEDAVAGVKPKLNDEEAAAVIDAFKEKQQAKQEEAQKVVAENNTKEGEKFLADNAKKEGVVVLPSGLQYKVITAGTGATPGAENTVKVNYKGTLIDGTEFDSSYKRGEPATFIVNQVIPGWVEALQLMKEGDKWELYVPAALAYGPGGAGGVIGPNQMLIFEVELLQAAVKEDASAKAGTKSAGDAKKGK
jgi:FKBP-type peptidyl-prolyl cis-trans isomerase